MEVPDATVTFTFVQDLKLSFPNSVTLAGIFIDSRLPHLSKTLSPIVVTPSGITKFFKL